VFSAKDWTTHGGSKSDSPWASRCCVSQINLCAAPKPTFEREALIWRDLARVLSSQAAWMKVLRNVAVLYVPIAPPM
jgi:hypothetical protein